MPFATRHSYSGGPAISRRGFGRVGMAGVLGLSLPQLLAAASQARAKRPGRAKNVLVILKQGGLSHIDTWDPKPFAIAEHRSQFKPISSVVPGIQFTELLTETAKVADKLTVVRSMVHLKGVASGHPDGTRYMLSGAHPTSPIPMPDIGSVASDRKSVV
jgi:hypothetical protein